MTHTPTDALRLVEKAIMDQPGVKQANSYGDISVRQIANAVLRVMGAAPASPLPGGGWRTDFENAPKDGSVFMVGYDDEAARKGRLWKNSERVYEARWNDVKETWSARNGFILHSDATHWMPLPAAPTGEPK